MGVFFYLINVADNVSDSSDMFFMLGVVFVNAYALDFLYVMGTTAAQKLSRDRDRRVIITQATCRWLARSVSRLCRTPLAGRDIEEGSQPVGSGWMFSQ